MICLCQAARTRPECLSLTWNCSTCVPLDEKLVVLLVLWGFLVTSMCFLLASGDGL